MSLTIASLDTGAENTWCPGCGDFPILLTFKRVVVDLVKEGKKRHEEIVAVSGIGCHGKIVDYLNINSFYSIHGRVPPVAAGIKLANPRLTVVGFAGDGDAYSEGIAHTIFSAKRNSDITLIVHDNRVFGLTTGQYTPTSPPGFKGRSTPRGTPEDPINPLEVLLASGATFIARSYSGRPDHLYKVMRAAIEHRGFAIVEVLQPCVAWFNTYGFYNQRVYELEDNDPTDYHQALELIREWNYDGGERIPIGVFYQVRKPTFEERVVGNRVLVDEEPVKSVRHVLEMFK